MNAAAHPDHGCRQEPGTSVPVVDRNRCEAKGECVRVCPYGVFEIRTLAVHERGRLPLLSKLKLFIHGNRQAFATYADRCAACGECVRACPERAITLRRT